MMSTFARAERSALAKSVLWSTFALAPRKASACLIAGESTQRCGMIRYSTVQNDSAMMRAAHASNSL